MLDIMDHPRGDANRDGFFEPDLAGTPPARVITAQSVFCSFFFSIDRKRSLILGSAFLKRVRTTLGVRNAPATVAGPVHPRACLYRLLGHDGLEVA